MRFAAWSQPVRAIVVFLALAAPASADDGELEEIVVTARKIEEDVRRVPVSIQVLDSAFFDETDPSSLYTLQFDVPGLFVQNFGFFGARVGLRGVSDQGDGIQTVAAHLNGVYLGRSDLLLARLFDMERAEVLKGPQGTLYGRNATAGSINLLARAPREGTSAALEAAAGSFETLRAEGHVNAGNDRVAFRLAGTVSGGDGYIRNTVDDRRFAEEDYYGLRAALGWRPTGDLIVNLFAQRVEDDGAANDLWLPNKNYLPEPDDLHLTTVTDPDPYLDLRNDLAGAELRWDLGGAELVSVTGYAQSHTNARDDCAGNPMMTGCVRTLLPWTWEQWSQELRLASSGPSGSWLAGLFLFDADEVTRYTLLIPGISPAVPVNDYRERSGLESWAVFGQATRDIGRFGLTAGLRYTADSMDLERQGEGVFDSDTPVVAEDSWDDLSWRVGVDYELDEQLMLYASVATGYKSGGVFIAPSAPGTVVVNNYEPENLTAFEAGVKWLSADSRRAFSTGAFYYDIEDLQVQTITLVNGALANVVDNAAAARVAGLDVATEARLGERASLTAGLIWLAEREFVEFESDGLSLAGNLLSRAPEWSASVSAAYRLPLGARGSLHARIDYAYRSGVFYTKENISSSSQGAFSLLDAFLRYESNDGRWYLFAAGRNLLDTGYFNQVFIQTAPGKPRHFEVGFGLTY
jgi:iron complex outermembrane receptor protein